MGTDIHMACEIKKNGQWKTLRERVFKSEWFKADSDYEPFTHEFTEIPYDSRCYNLFGMLADVRNGTGFAGCRIGEPFDPISEPKGLPYDVCEETKGYLSDEHSASYLTLSEIENYDWSQAHRDYGVVSEASYRDYVMKGKQPESWCGGCSGGNIVHLTEPQMVDLIKGKYQRDINKSYYTECYFTPCTYAECSGGFYDRVVPVLRSLIPTDGTSDDVRLVFDFDS